MSSEDEEFSSSCDSFDSDVKWSIKSALEQAAYKTFFAVFDSIEFTRKQTFYEWKNSDSNLFCEVQNKMDELMNGFEVPNTIDFDALCSVRSDFVAPPHDSLYLIPGRKKKVAHERVAESTESFIAMKALSSSDNLKTAFKTFEIYLRFLIQLHKHENQLKKRPKILQAVKCFVIACERNVKKNVVEFLTSFGSEYPVVNKLWKAGRVYGMLIAEGYEKELIANINRLNKNHEETPDSDTSEYKNERVALVTELDRLRSKKVKDPAKRSKEDSLTMRSLSESLEEFKSEMQVKLKILEDRLNELNMNDSKNLTKMGCLTSFDLFFRFVASILIFVSIIFR
jgi:hypothetical protein